MRKLNVENIDPKGKLCLLRCDFNVPLNEDGQIQNDRRIQASLKTIQYLRDKGARLVLLSHLGRPKGKLVEGLRMAPVAKRLGELLNMNIHYARDCIGKEAQESIQKLKGGQIVLLENLRFHKEETQNDSGFASQLAHLGGDVADYFINDAFGTAHRAHASTVGLTKYLKSAAGYLMQSEMEHLNKISANPQRPLLAICGGVKVSDKIGLIQSLLKLTDHTLIGGAMAFTFLRAQGYETGQSLVEEEQIELARNILERHAEKITLPIDFMCTPLFDFKKRELGPLTALSYKNIHRKHCALDIGPQSITAFKESIQRAKTIFWNGPMGVFEFEATSQGTLAIAQATAEASVQGAFSVIGGGDSIAALAQANLSDKVSYISTGGGASLQFLENPNLPGICALSDAAP